MVVDQAGTIRFANAAAERLFGYGRGGLNGHVIAELIPEYLRERGLTGLTAWIPALRRDEAGTTRSVPALTRDRGEIHLDISAARFEQEGRRFVAVLLTEPGEASTPLAREELLARERQARREAERANRMKTEFLATISHEVRTPINAIVGYADLLDMELAGPLSKKQRAHVARLRESSRHLMRLMEDLLDLSRIEAGRLVVRRERHVLEQAVTASLELNRHEAARRGVHLVPADAPPADLCYFGDEGRVRQVLINLLSNAVKFSDPGGRVVVSWGSARDVLEHPVTDPEGPWVFVRVMDEGVGIPAEQLERIFEPFVQGESGRARGGAGLGLAISRRLAWLMGGELTAASNPGKGSTFTLWLPREVPVAEAVGEALSAGAGAGAATAGRRLLAGLDALRRRFVDRLGADPAIRGAVGLPATDLEDHTAAFLTDVAHALIAAGDTADPTGMVRDAGEIQRIIADLHGAQRRRLGWTEAELDREFALLQEEVLAELEPALAGLAEAGGERVRRLAAEFLDAARVASLRGWRAAQEG
jgi:PAS domain S-box-containing protein